MVHRAADVSRGQPQEGQAPMCAVMARIGTDDLPIPRDRSIDLPEGFQGDGPVILGHEIPAIGGKRLIEISNRRSMIIPDGCDHAEIVQHSRMCRTMRKDLAISLGRLFELAGSMKAHGLL